MKKMVIALFLLSSICCSKSESNAKEFLIELYTKYQKDFMQVDIKSDYADSILAPELLRLVRMDENRPDGDNGYLDWDPLCDCQDPEGIRLGKVTISTTNGTVEGKVTLEYIDTVKTIKFILVKHKNNWLIRDIGSETNPSLYDYLMENLKNDFPDSMKVKHLKKAMTTTYEKNEIEEVHEWTDTMIGSWYVRINSPEPGEHPGIWEGPVEIGKKPGEFSCTVDTSPIMGLRLGQQANVLIIEAFSGSRVFDVAINVDSCCVNADEEHPLHDKSLNQ